MAQNDVSDESSAGDAGRRRRKPRRRVRILFGVVAFVAVIIIVGFLRFAESVSGDATVGQPQPADGIVVFTGGQDRIAGAVTLLADGIAERLLISGVHPRTTQRMLSDFAGIQGDLFSCCIDLGREARDTIGNADETAAWARSHDFKSLIVVTSSYHMPRSLTELGHALPGVRLQGYSVSPSLDLSHWWQNPGTIRLLVSEYVKYLATHVRLTVSPRPGREAEGAT